VIPVNPAGRAVWQAVGMFFTKRQERDKQDLAGPYNRFTEAVLKNSSLGLFLLDSKERIQPQTSKALNSMFRRPEVVNLSIEKLIAPLVTAKTLSAVRACMARMLEGLPADDENPLQDVEVRLPNPNGGFETAHYSFDFATLDNPRGWLVRVTDITARVQQQRELEDLRANVQTQGEILRSVLHAGGARFGEFLQATDETLKIINGVLKKPARAADAFRSKLEETLEQVDRVRRDATALKLSGLESAARNLEDALQDLRVRGNLSGSDFLPLAVKLDQLFFQFSLLRTLTTQASPPRSGAAAAPDARVTDNGTQIIEAPKFEAELLHSSGPLDAAPALHAAAAPARRAAAAGSLASTLTALTELAAQEQQKNVVLESAGLDLVPTRYQAAIKNIGVQLIRNALLHGIEPPAERQAAGKKPHGTLQLEFRIAADQSFELLFQDDGRGIDPDLVRSTAVARGLLSEDAASRLRDRQAIKLIFKSGFTTIPGAPADASHGAGMSLVRRYVHEAGGRIALASLLGHETRFKITMPALEAGAAQEVA
jgi:two-component system, chemotaxis family, sensor kinase CheA